MRPLESETITVSILLSFISKHLSHSVLTLFSTRLPHLHIMILNFVISVLIISNARVVKRPAVTFIQSLTLSSMKQTILQQGIKRMLALQRLSVVARHHSPYPLERYVQG
tara:strand:- start:747 stop:1076 length:330 start_codon:yes stop_codon:yes gene_type:complete